MTAPTISPLPTPPQRRNSPSDFATKADAFLGALPTFQSEANTAIDFVNTKADATETNADSAATAAATALASANYKGPWSSLTGALNIPASVTHNGTAWLLTQNLADVTAAEPGVHAAWSALTAVGVVRFTVVSTAVSRTASAREWVEVTAAGTTQTLPASPAVNTEICIAAGNFSDTVVGRNGNLIMGVAEDMTIDIANRAVPLIYVGGSLGWRLA